MACHGLVLDLNKELNTARLSSTCSFTQVSNSLGGLFWHVRCACADHGPTMTKCYWLIELPMNTNESSHASPLTSACLHVRSSLMNILVAPTWSPHWLERSHRRAVACPCLALDTKVKTYPLVSILLNSLLSVCGKSSEPQVSPSDLRRSAEQWKWLHSFCLPSCWTLSHHSNFGFLPARSRTAPRISKISLTATVPVNGPTSALDEKYQTQNTFETYQK